MYFGGYIGAMLGRYRGYAGGMLGIYWGYVGDGEENRNY